MKTRRVQLDFHVFDYKILEVYLHQMALKGWLFQGFGTALKDTMLFQKGDAAAINYRVDYADGANHSKAGDEREEYRRFVEDYGYRFISGSFCLDVYEQTTAQLPIREQNEADHAYMKRSVLHEMLLPVMMLILSCLQILSHWSRLREVDYAETMPLVLLISWLVLGFCYLLKLLRDVLWLCHRQSKTSLRRILVYSNINSVILLVLLLSIAAMFDSRFAFTMALAVSVISLVIVVEHAFTDHTLRHWGTLLKMLFLCGCIVCSINLVFHTRKELAIMERNSTITLSNGSSAAMITRESILAKQSFCTINHQIYRWNLIHETPLSALIMDQLMNRADATLVVKEQRDDVLISIQKLEPSYSGILHEELPYRLVMVSDHSILSSEYPQQPAEQELKEMLQVLQAFVSAE